MIGGRAPRPSAPPARITVAVTTVVPARPRVGTGALALSLALVVLVTCVAPACSTVHLDDPPADVNACRPSQMFFADHIWPEFLAQTYSGKRCGDSRCHDTASGRPFQAVMPASAPIFPFAPQSDWEQSYLSATQQMICTNVRASELYTRPAGLRTHGGGALIQPDGPEALLLAMWVVATP